MLLTIDKRGSIILPAAIRKELGLEIGSHVELLVTEGGSLLLQPVVIYRTVRLSESGLNKLEEARQSGLTDLPPWLTKDIQDAAADSEPEVS